MFISKIELFDCLLTGKNVFILDEQGGWCVGVGCWWWG
jgi:hypothetical protein